MEDDKKPAEYLIAIFVRDFQEDQNSRVNASMRLQSFSFHFNGYFMHKLFTTHFVIMIYVAFLFHTLLGQWRR